MVWIRGAVVRHTVDFNRRAHRERPQSSSAADCVQFAFRAGRKVTLRGPKDMDVIYCELKVIDRVRDSGTNLKEGETP